MTTDPRSLIGGHATGTLSSDEKRDLYRAALSDQDLFDALVQEEPLREALEDPVVSQRLLAVLADDRPQAARPWFSSDWIPAAAALLLAAALVPLASTLLERRSEPIDRTVGVSQPSDASVVVSALEWAAALERVNADPDRLTVRTSTPKEFEPLARRRRVALRIVPDRSGRAMVVGIDSTGRPEKVYPPGEAEWADVQADTPVDVPLPASASRYVEFRLVLVESGADVRDLPARLDEGRAIVLSARPD